MLQQLPLSAIDMIRGEELPDGVGSVERRRRCRHVADPLRERARLTELTPRGRRALRVMRSNALDVEKRWRDVLGEHRFGELRETLLALLSAETGES